jgi:uncharacterized protein YqeY
MIFWQAAFSKQTGGAVVSAVIMGGGHAEIITRLAGKESHLADDISPNILRNVCGSRTVPCLRSVIQDTTRVVSLSCSIGFEIPIVPGMTRNPTRYNGTMDTKEELAIALKDAIRAGDDVRKRSIRMVLAAVRQVEIDRQVKLDEAAVLSIIQKEIKTRKESVEEARQANRPDIVAATQAEIVVLQGYLPEAMDAVELNQLVEIAIAETGARSPADMGKVMKLLMPRVAGRASGDQISTAVRQLLQK